jgi:hypothetical protein
MKVCHSTISYVQPLTPFSVTRKDPYAPTVLVRSGTASFYSLFLVDSPLAALEVKVLLGHPPLHHRP